MTLGDAAAAMLLAMYLPGILMIAYGIISIPLQARRRRKEAKRREFLNKLKGY